VAEVGVWDFYESLSAETRDGLTVQQRAVAAICDLRQEVNSGGFDRYFRYWGGDSAPVALGALPRMLSSEWADLLREAMTLLGPDYPVGPEERATRIDRFDLEEQLEELDSRFFELEAGADADRLLSDQLVRRVADPGER
jgi:hypothetical protein